MQFATFTPEERDLVQKIEARLLKRDPMVDVISFEMDLSCVHANTPLDFQKLAEFDEFNFVHDAYGIMDYLCRKTGQLINGFLPRCTKGSSNDSIYRD